MTLRIGFDMDGVLADFASAFREIERDLFGSDEVEAPPPEEEEERASAGSTTKSSAVAVDRTREQRRRAVWQRIEETENFWTTLKPTDAGAVARVHAQMLQYRWEVFFLTQRPATAGETVQRQTQRWLIQHGFDMPSVLVIGGSRGAAANALRLTYHVDDSPRNCLDVKSDSSASPILLVGAREEATARQARKLGIGVARSINECLDILDQASAARREPGVLARLAAIVGWK
jgi:phosphoglycolate phosphatase-like HAD superfamily hydrolase